MDMLKTIAMNIHLKSINTLHFLICLLVKRLTLMSRVITLSRTYPSYHIRAGEPTYFVEQALNWYWDSLSNPYHNVFDMFEDLNGDKFSERHIDALINTIDTELKTRKFHTIRKGNRWKVGEMASLRVWSGKPYRSKQFTIAPDVKISKIYTFEIKKKGFYINDKKIGSLTAVDVSINDGLDYKDFLSWFKFPKPFRGQVLCWDENIKY